MSRSKLLEVKSKRVCVSTKILRSLSLVGLLELFSTHDDSVLELGCNAGRNLNYLHKAGYSELTGVDINSEALELLRQEHPKLAESASLHRSWIA
jgi:SAM-dependent methyltransferase